MTIGDGDFLADMSGTLSNVRTNDATYTFSMTISGDDMLEADEILDIALIDSDGPELNRDVVFSNSNTPTTGDADDLEITTEIHNDDDSELNIDPIAYNGDENAGPIAMTFTLSAPIDLDLDISLNDIMGTATFGNDYTFANTVTIQAGWTTLGVNVVFPNSDTIVERDETVGITIPSNGLTIADNNYLNDGDGFILDIGAADAATITIDNDDETVISITVPTPNNMDEGDGSNTMDFVINSSLQVDESFVVTFDINGINGNSSTDGGANMYTSDLSFDNNETEGGSVTLWTVEFDAFSTASQTVTVTALDDNIVELDEYFSVSLETFDSGVFTEGRQASISVAANSATGIIDNDDVAYFVINDNIEAREGDDLVYQVQITNDGNQSNGSNNARIDVTGSGATDVVVNYSIGGGMMNPIDAITDIGSMTGTIEFEAIDGITQDSQTLEITTLENEVNGRQLVEADESVIIGLTSIDELGIVVDASVGVTMVADEDEGTGVIYNDDDLEFSFTSVADVNKLETTLGNDYTIDISNPISNTVTVSVFFTSEETVPGSNNDVETDGTDYNIIGPSNLNFDAPGASAMTKTITFSPLGALQETYTFGWISDPNTVEPNEWFDLTLNAFDADWVGSGSNTNPVTISSSSNTVNTTIIEANTATFSISSDVAGNSVTEGDTGDNPVVTFTVSIDKNLENPIDIEYLIQDYSMSVKDATAESNTGAAVGDNDYDPDYNEDGFSFGLLEDLSSMTATVAHQFTITINGDNVVELDEHFISSIAFEEGMGSKGYQNVVISEAPGDNDVVTKINNDDNAVVIIEKGAEDVATDGSVNEADPDLDADFLVKFDPTYDVLVDVPVVLNFATRDGGISRDFEAEFVQPDNNAKSTNDGVGRDDFVVVNKTITINSGESSISQTVTIIDDEVVELQQRYEVVVVSDGVFAMSRTVDINHVGGNTETTAVGTIGDDDNATISITADVSSVVEGNSGTSPYGFTIVSDHEVEIAAGYTVDYDLVEGTATDVVTVNSFDDDFDPEGPQVISFTGEFNAVSQESQTIDVLINGDLDVELLNEEFGVQLTTIDPNDGLWTGKITLDMSGGDQDTGTIVDNDQAIISVTTVANPVVEGTLSVNNAVFNVYMSAKVDQDINIPYVFISGTAFEVIDWGATNPVSGDLLYSAGQEGLQPVVLDIVNDDLVEDDEIFRFKLRRIEDGFNQLTTRDVIFVGNVSELNDDVTIQDDDVAYVHLEADKSFNEGNGTNTITFEVTLDGIVDKPFTVSYLTEDGFDLNGNNTSPNAALVAGANGSGGDDYEATSNRLTFDANTRNQVNTITITINGDEVIEMDEFFEVTLDNNGIGDTSSPFPKTPAEIGSAIFGYNIQYKEGDPGGSGAELGNSGITHTANVINDDIGVVVLTHTNEGNDFEIREPDNFTTPGADMTFKVAIVGAGTSTISAVDVPVTVDFATVLLATFDAANAADFTSTPSGLINFPAGVKPEDVVTVSIADDFIVELDEKFDLTVDNLVARNRAITLEDEDMGATPNALTKRNTITNEDKVFVEMSIDPASFDEGSDGGANTRTFTLTLVDQGNNGTLFGTVQEIDRDLLIDIEDITGVLSGAKATFAVDYNIDADSNTNPIILSANSTTTTFELYVEKDDIVERAESLALNIEDLIIGDWNGTAFDNVYAAYNADVESSATAGSATATINNDDITQLSITTASSTGSEGNAGDNTVLTFNVHSSNAVDTSFDVDFEILTTENVFVMTADDAAENADFDALMGTVSFAGNVGEVQVLTVTIFEENIVELDEEFGVELSLSDMTFDANTVNPNSTGRMAQFVNDTANGVIQNDDTAIITIDDPVAVREDKDGATTNLVYTVSISNPVDDAFTVPYTITDDGTLGTVDSNDYSSATSGSVSYNLSGTTTSTDDQTITVVVTNDNVVEPDETIVATLTPVMDADDRSIILTAADASVAQGTSTILNDDSAEFTIDVTAGVMGNSVSEGTTGSDHKDVTYTITMSNPANRSVSVDINHDLHVVGEFEQGVAVGGNMYDDYDADNAFDGNNVPNKTISFAAGVTSMTYTFTVADDNLVELDEIFLTGINMLNTSAYNGQTFDNGLSNALTISTVENDVVVEVVDLDEAVINVVHSEGPPFGEADIDFLVFELEVTADIDPSLSVTLDYMTFDVGPTLAATASIGGATPDVDFVALSANTGTLVSSSDFEYVVIVDVLDDNIVERDEWVGLSIDNLMKHAQLDVSIGIAAATGTIRNDDEVFASISGGNSVLEPDFGDANAVSSFSITLSDQNGGAVDMVDNTVVLFSIDFGGVSTASSDGSGDVLIDYEGFFSFAVIDALQSSVTFSVDVLGDNVVENDETILKSIFSPDFASEFIFVTTQTKAEFEAWLSANIDDENFFDLLEDYVDQYGIGEYTSTVEGTASIDVEEGVSAATNTILNNDNTVFSLQALNGGSDEEDGGEIIFELTSSLPVDESYAVLYSLDAMTVTLNAAEEDDYSSGGDFIFPAYDGGVQGPQAATVTISFNIDNIVELDEEFTMNVETSHVYNNAIGEFIFDFPGDGRMFTVPGDLITAQGVIENDDDAIITITPLDATDESVSQEFVINITNPVDEAFTVEYSITNDGTLGTVDSDDYVGATTGTFTYGLTETYSVWTDITSANSQTLDPGISDDSIVEPDENIAITLSAVTDAGGRNIFLESAMTPEPTLSEDYDVLNNDLAEFTLNVDAEPAGGSKTIEEGDTNVKFTVTSSKDFNADVNIDLDFDLSDLQSDIQNPTYPDYNDGQLDTTPWFTFGNGASQSQSFTFMINEDQLVELNEWFTVALQNLDVSAYGSLAFGGSGTASTDITVPGGTDMVTVTIDDNDQAEINIAKVSGSSISEADAGSTDIEFEITVSKDIDPDMTVTVDYATSDVTTEEAGSTAGDDDYVGIGATTSVALKSKTPGTYIIPVTVNADNTVELDETFNFTISDLMFDAGLDVVLGDTKTVSGEIVNDDQVELRISSVGTVGETNVDQVSTFTLTLDAQAGSTAINIDEDLIVNISGSDFNFGAGLLATQNVDYTIASQTITLSKGFSSTTFDVTIEGEQVVERDELFEITIADIAVASPEITAYTTGDMDVIINTTDANDVAGLTITNDDETTFSLENDGGPLTSENYPKRDEDESFTYTVRTSHAIESYNGESFGIGYTILNGGAAQIKYRDTEDVEDFVTPLTGTITFDPNPGVNAFKTQQVTMVDEVLVELDEDFRFRVDEIDPELNLNGRMAQFTSGNSFREFIGIIEDSDVAFVSVVVQGDSDKLETDLGENDELVFDVTLSAPVDDLVSVTYSSLDGFVAEPGQDATTADSDYTSKVGTASFDARTTASQTITIPILGDYKVEDDEKVGVLIQDLKVDNVLVGPGSLWVEEVSVMTATTEGTIINDDAATIIVNDASLNAGNEFEGDISGTPGKSTFEVYLYDRTEYVDNGVFIPVSVDRDVSIQFISQDGDAGTLNGLDTNAGSDDGPKNDFVSANGTLVFPKNSDAAQIVQVTYVVDDEPENDEEFKVQLQNATLAFIPDADLDPGTVSRAVNVDLANRTGLGLILNDDRPKFSVSTTGGSEDSGIVEFTISLDGPIIGAATVTVDYAVVGDTADQGVDYTDNLDGYTGTVTFVSGNSSTVVTLEVVDDVIGEGNEELTMTILNPQASNKAELSDIPGDLSATATITDNDVINVTVVTSDATIGEDGGTVIFTIDIDKDITGGDVTMDFDILGALVSGNTATVTNDYTTASTSGVITFPNGSMAGDSQTIEITLVDDAIVEGDEFVSVQLSNIATTIPDGQAALNIPNAQTEITDNDNAVISIADFIANESTETATVVVSTSALIDRDVTVLLTTSEIGGTEAEDGGVDFATTSQTIVIPAEMTSGSFAIALNNDDLVEGDEDFNIAIGIPTGAGTMNDAAVAAGTSTAVVTIDDDDSSVLAIAATASVVENVAGGIVNVAVTLSKAVDEDVTFTVNTADVSTDGDDFTAIAAMTFTINSGDTSIDVPVTITNTNLVELSETFTITISDLVVAGGIMDKDVTLGNDVSTVTITDDDQATISIANISDTEENLGGAQVVAITMNNPVDTDVTFLLNTVEGTAKSTDDGSTPIIESDFVKIEDQLITIDGNGGLAPNTTVFVTINDDDLVEADESFALRLGTLLAGGRNVVFSSAAATVDATVSIDETDKSTISLANITQSEALGTMNFDIQITKPIDQPVNLTVNTRVVTATPGADYTAISDATYVIPAGTLSASLLDLPVTIVTDNLVEATESFTLELSGLTVTAGRDVSFTGLGATLNASGTITDNDEAQITFDVTNNPVGTEGVGQFISFKIDMSNPVDQTVTFDYATNFNANASIGFDAENKSNQLTYGAGNNTDKTVTVNLVNNEIVEGDEFFDLLLTNLAVPAGRNVYFYDLDAMTTTTSLSSTATIEDDDTAIISIAGDAVTEDVDGNAVLVLTTDRQIDKSIDVDVTLTDDTANDGSDYDATGLVNATINALATTGNLTVPILGGDIVEGTETFDVTISDVAMSLTLDGYNIFIDSAPDNVGTVTITDNDVTTLDIADATVSEDGGSITIEVSTAKAFDSDVTVEIDFADVSTIAGDFDHTATSIQIDEGALSGTITVAITDDNIVDGTEEFTGTISNLTVVTPVGANDYMASINDNLGEFTIFDAGDHADFSVTVDAASFIEGASATLTVTNNGEQVDEDVTVSFTYTDGTAEDGSDYTSVASVVVGQLTSSATLSIATLETPGQPNGVLVEDTEDFMLNILSLSVANVAAHSVSINAVNAATVTIDDNDAAQLAVSDITVDEDAGSVTVELTTTNEIDNDVTVDIDYADIGLAVNGVDYNNGPANVTILSGDLSADIVIPIIDNDMVVEADETFGVTANTVTIANTGDNNVTVGTANAVVTIDDADATTVSVLAATVGEADGTISVQVQTDNGYTFDKEVTVAVDLTHVSTVDGDFTDFVTTETISIAEGASSGSVTFTVVDDNIVDATESFTALISDLSVGAGNTSPDDTYDASINVSTNTMTITDNDTAEFTIADGSGTEGGTALMTITSNLMIDENVELTFTFTDGVTAQGAFEGDDYTAISVPVQLDAMSMTKTFTIDLPNTPGVNGEVVEGTEMFTVDIDAITSVTMEDHSLIENDGTAEVTIEDNDMTVVSLAANSAVEGANMEFVVNSALEFDKDVTVTVTTTSNTANALAADDYTELSVATLTILQGATSGTITTATLDNNIVEGTEDFSAMIADLSVGVGLGGYDANIGVASATFTINDDDETTVNIIASSADEGSDVVISIESTLPFDKDVTVDLASMGGTASGLATATTDYGTVGASVTIMGGATSGSINVSTVDDNIVDGTETFSGTISNLSVGSVLTDGYNAVLGTTTTNFTINDLDAALFSIADATGTEGGNAEVTLTTDVVLDEIANVTFWFTNVTAESGLDYTEVSVPVSIAAGSMTSTLTIPLPNTTGVLGEVVEGTETFTVDIVGISVENDANHDVSGGDGTATVSVEDNDMTTVSLTGAVAEEGESMSYEINSDLEFDKDVTVSINTVNNTAISGASQDYIALAGSLITIQAGTTTGVITRGTVENEIVEGTEDYSATISVLSVGSGDGYDASIGVASATYTINDDDRATLSIAGDLVVEGVTATVTVSTDKAADENITVDINTSNGSAAAGADYTAVSTTVTIPAGSTSATQDVSILDESIVEATESLNVTISNEMVANDRGHDVVIGTATDQVEITDNDAAVINIVGVSVNEDEGSADVTLTISNQVDEDIKVTALTSDGTASPLNGIAKSGQDYTTKNQVVTFPALSVATQTVTVAVLIDNTVEYDENFVVNLSNLVVNGGRNVTLTNTSAVVDILNDDQAIISIADITVKEVDKQAIMSITMSNPVDQAVTVTGNTRPTGSAAKGNDYDQISGKSYTFDAGETFTNAEVIVTIVDDNLVEATESFLLELSDIVANDKNVVFSSGGATDAGEITVTDADAATISVSNDTKTEKVDANMLFTVSLSAPVDKSVTITANTLSGTAIGGLDFTSIVNSPITFSPTDNQPQTFIVPIVDNDIVEATEEFILELTNITVEAGRDVTFVGGGSSTTGVGTITDDDEAFISINNVTMNEGNDGTQTYTFNVTLDKAVDQNVTVDFATADGTAIEAENDYDGNSGTLDFTGAEGQVLTVPVIINGDLIVEDDEIFTVILDNLVVEGERKVSISTESGIGTGILLNDDSRPVIDAGQEFLITEDPAEIGAVLGPVKVTQLNGSVVTWEIVSTVGVDENGGTATVTGTEFSASTANASGEGGITVVSELDREKVQTYTLTMTVNDGLNTSEPVDVTVVVTDINDTAPVVTPATFSVLDNVGLGKEVGTVEATDADTEVLTTFDWLLEPAGNEDGIFTIDRETGVISILDNQNLDADDKDQYQLSVRVSDATSGTQPRNTSAAQIIVVNIIDTNDPPHDIILTDASDEDEIPSTIDIIETAGPDIIVGTLSTEDVDVGDTHSYTLVEGNGAINNDFFKIEGDKLVTNALMDFEITPTLSIRVRSTDAIGESFEKVFVINVVQDITLEIEFTNTITPNNDGINDAIVLNNIVNFPDAQIIIAIGSKVIYNNIGYTVPFNGTYNGNPLPTGAYPVLIKKASGQKIKGFIYILTN
ncbi:MAG: Calx-beta domain-containing protein [Cyclobacteriaceae bacterium]